MAMDAAEAKLLAVGETLPPLPDTDAAAPPVA